MTKKLKNKENININFNLILIFLQRWIKNPLVKYEL